eukprot:105984_1
MQVDIASSVENDAFKKMFIQGANSFQKITKKQVELLREMFEKNVNNISDVCTFLKMNRKTFSTNVKKYTKIKPAILVKFYKHIRYTLAQKAAEKQLGEMLSETNSNIIDSDYHHVLNFHINYGNKQTIENTFRFFNIAVHYEDQENETENCRSFKRRQQRTNKMNASEEYRQQPLHKTKKFEDKKIWNLQQYYLQSQLDVIHSYLVHSNWHRMVQLHSKQQFDDREDEIQIRIDDREDEYIYDKDDNIEAISMQNKDKYISNQAEFGFGVLHEYDQLKPIFDSLYDEVINNDQFPLKQTTFHNLLIKAINSHKIAFNDKKLICKTYNHKYQIIRNQAIGICHILAIIIYTDISKFCTGFRKTYRKIKYEIDEEAVTNRHKQLYYYARSLFESVELFGQEMSTKMSVYHGLNVEMKFRHFTEYFNQPMSTTTSFKTAQEFSQGIGIILELKSAAKYMNACTKKPKYLSVSFLSSFPKEDEKLFYGSFVALQISDITQSHNMVHHSKELKMFNKFQQVIQNQIVDWKAKGDDNDMIDALTVLVQNQQNNTKILMQTDENENEEKKSEYISNYGQSLFDFFCNHPKTTKIGINNFYSLPEALKNVLFQNENENENKKQISIVPAVKLLP